MTSWLIRTEAGSGIGLGHLSRCSSLAAALRERGIDCLLVLAGDGDLRRACSQSSCEVLRLGTDELGSEEDLRRTLELARGHGCDGVVVDSYRVDGRYLSMLRSGVERVVAIDDLAAFEFPAQVVINGSVGASALPYRSSSGDTRFLLGPEYVMLRRAFWDVGTRQIRSSATNVVVTMGGADSANASVIALQALADMRTDVQVTVAIGPYFRHEESVREVATRIRHPVRFASDPSNMLELMLGADLAISAAGQTLYELAATGTPVVAVCVADNQRQNLEAFARHGAVASVGFASRGELRAAIADAVDSMLLDADRRRQMSAAALRLVSGAGARNVASALECEL